jgi:hypothetical protein
VEYAKANSSPAISIKSLPELGDAIRDQPRKAQNSNAEKESDSVSTRTRSKIMFR